MTNSEMLTWEQAVLTPIEIVLNMTDRVLNVLFYAHHDRFTFYKYIVHNRPQLSAHDYPIYLPIHNSFSNVWWNTLASASLSNTWKCRRYTENKSWIHQYGTNTLSIAGPNWLPITIQSIYLYLVKVKYHRHGGKFHQLNKDSVGLQKGYYFLFDEFTTVTWHLATGVIYRCKDGEKN